MRPIPILFLAADPLDMARLALGEEARAIRHKLRQSHYRDAFELITRWATRPDEVLECLAELRPLIVHFGCHGSASGQIVLQGDDGRSAPIPEAALERIFAAHARDVKLVVLNACYSGAQAEVIARSVDCVIGMRAATSDAVARRFAAGFYCALGAGRDVRDAFEQAVASTAIAAPACDAAPALLARDGVDPAQIVPVRLTEDPLRGLPAVPEHELPAQPFRYLEPLDEQHAATLFGRGEPIRAIYDSLVDPGAWPLVLVFGQTGVGKSSILLAGLLPRLRRHHEVAYVRRDPALGLRGSLVEAMGGDWHATEERAGKPLIVILDHVEEAFTEASVPPTASETRAQVAESKNAESKNAKSNAGPDAKTDAKTDAEPDAKTDAEPDAKTDAEPDAKIDAEPDAKIDAEPDAEIAELVDLITSLFGQPATRPRGRLILSFRKEWLPEVEARLDAARLPRIKHFIEPMSALDIRQVVTGLHSTPALRRAYPMDIEPELDAAIAGDLVGDPDSAVGPMLSILMTRLWNRAHEDNPTQPALTLDLFRAIKAEGLHLDTFLARRLDALRDTHAVHVDSGLVLDVLLWHTTPLGTARGRERAERYEEYDHLPAETVDQLVSALQRHYLLVEPRDWAVRHEGATRLAHDTLAPVVREATRTSERPGQLARKLLEHRAVEERLGGALPPLTERVYQTIRAGRDGMRAWHDEERQLLDRTEQQLRAQRAQRRKQARRKRALAAGLAIGAIAVAAMVWTTWRSHRAEESARAQARAFEAQAAAESVRQRDGDYMFAAVEAYVDPSLQVAYLRGVDNRGAQRGWRRLAIEVLNRPVAAAVLRPDNAAAPSEQPGDDVAAADKDDEQEERDERDASIAAALWLPGRGGVLLVAGRVVQRWSLDAIHEPKIIISAPARLQGAALSPDGARLVTYYAKGEKENKNAHVWSIADGALLATLAHDRRVMNAAFGARGVATALRGGAVHLWDRDGAAVGVCPGDQSIYALRFDESGTRLGVGFESRARVCSWDTPNAPILLDGHKKRIHAIQFSPDGAYVATGSADKTARLWRADGGFVREFASDVSVQAIAFTPDDQIVYERRRGVVAWCPVSGAACSEYDAHDKAIKSIAVAAGPTVVTASLDGAAYSRRGAGPGRVIARHPVAIQHAAFGADGALLLTVSDDNTARIWRVDAPYRGDEVVREIKGECDLATPDSDGKSRAGIRWEGKDVWVRPDDSDLEVRLRGHRGAVTSARWPPDSPYVESCASDETVRRWHLRDVDALGGAIDAVTTRCLTRAERRNRLGESEEDAKRAEKSCHRQRAVVQ